jgi:hypothetical protein
LHSAAGALDAWAAPPADTAFDQAMAALAERYPGAPEHWLAYIAERAPHLAQADESAPLARSETPEPRPMAEETWTRRAKLALNGVTAHRKPSITFGWPHPKDARPSPALSLSVERAPRRPVLKFAATRPERRSGLRLPAIRRRAAPRLELEARRPQPAAAPLALDQASHMRDAAPFAPWGSRVMRRARPPPPWIDAPKPTESAPAAWLDPPADQWPSLPPVVEEALEEPAATPDAARFRAEQDEGAWSA